MPQYPRLRPRGEGDALRARHADALRLDVAESTHDTRSSPLKPTGGRGIRARGADTS